MDVGGSQVGLLSRKLIHLRGAADEKSMGSAPGSCRSVGGLQPDPENARISRELPAGLDAIGSACFGCRPVSEGGARKWDR